MISTGEIRKGNGEIDFSLTVLEATQLRPKPKLVNAKSVSSSTKQNRLPQARAEIIEHSETTWLGLSETAYFSKCRPASEPEVRLKEMWCFRP